ncbi:hypothetical protein F0562_030406 [Nyssa sinensis]|uniref:CCHC-type domain-containing protein n=1 Tax=Nyssa sinensis TaxID=561372 RepID=A0A5J5AWU4_9ASTE|nr:hypothetical protein F0562_030406 [Nyssa sinensis]
MDEDDLTDKILNGLGADYKELIHAVQARDTMIMFDELHEKLLNFEASLQAAKSDPSHFPASANPANCTTTSWGPSSNPGTTNHNRRPSTNSGNTSTGWRPSPNTNNRSPAFPNAGPNSSRSHRPSSRPYLGYCQICGIQGHTAKRCPSFRLVPLQPNITPVAPVNRTPTPWQPRAHFAANTTPTAPQWLLDSGASHHVTADLKLEKFKAEPANKDSREKSVEFAPSSNLMFHTFKLIKEILHPMNNHTLILEEVPCRDLDIVDGNVSVTVPAGVRVNDHEWMTRKESINLGVGWK